MSVENPATESPPTDPRVGARRGIETRGERVVVVGGGIIGLGCAHYLRQAGYAVTVIDRRGIGKACSHANCGMICPSHVLPLNEPGAIREGLLSLLRPSAPFKIKPQLRVGLYRWFFEFARRCTHGQMLEAGRRLLPILESSMAEYHVLFSALRAPSPGERSGQHEDSGPSGQSGQPKEAGQWKENGLAYVFEETSGLDGFAKTDRLLAETYGVAARRIEGEELQAYDAALRPDLAGALVYDEDGSVRPDQLVRDWRSSLEAEGVELLEDCALESVGRSGGRIDSIRTSQGALRADHFVFALGAWSQRWSEALGCRLPVEPGKGYSVTMGRPRVCPRHPMLFPERRIGITPFDDGFRIGSMMEFAGWDSSIPQRRIEQLRDSAAPYLVSPVGRDVEETWYGWRPMTWDSLPIIGRVPGLDNALLATGHNMLGLTLATGTGRLIAELIQESPTHIDPAAYSPDRF